MSAPRVPVGSVWRPRRSLDERPLDRGDCLATAVDDAAVYLLPAYFVATGRVFAFPRRLLAACYERIQ